MVNDIRGVQIYS